MLPDLPECQPEEPYAEVWARVFLSGACGMWTMRQGQPVCPCGTVLPAAEKAAA
jgi:hypothetical protein